MRPSPAPTAVVADDERLMRDQIIARLKEAWPELLIVGEAGNGSEAIALVQSEEPDIVFLDISMPGMDGIQAAQALAGQVHVVFVTAHDEYAISAFEHGAVDYVLKPAEPERVALTCERLRARLKQAPDPMNDLLAQLSQRLGTAGLNPREYMRWVQASVGANIRMIPTSDILFFRAEDKYTRVQTQEFRGADSQTDQGADRGAGPERILADPSRHRRPRRCGRTGQPQLPRPSDRAREGQRRKTRSEPQLQSSVQADVASRALAARFCAERRT